MYLKTTSEVVSHKLRHMQHAITVLQYTDRYKCDSCSREYGFSRYDGESRRTLRVTCLCNTVMVIQ